MKLRLLEEKDVEGMLEWMHDPKVNCFFRFDAEDMTCEKAIGFVKHAKETAENNETFHFAIVDDDDQYMGTVSLKDIDWEAKAAEYAISLRSASQGNGYGSQATRAVLEYAFKNLKLNRVFLNVLSDNETAIRMYEKCGFRYEGEFRNHICIRGKIKSLKWFAILKNEFTEE